MLTVDLARLERQGRLTIDDDLSPDDPLWEGTDVRLRGPLAVRLEAQQMGTDVLVRGRLRGDVEYQCRRCLEPVVLSLDEPVTFVFRRGLGANEAEREEVYPLPDRARELDLSGAVREHLLLAVPKFVVCNEWCRGLCPQCGVNLNEGTCTCEPPGSDDRWAPLRGLKID